MPGLWIFTFFYLFISFFSQVLSRSQSELRASEGTPMKTSVTFEHGGYSHVWNIYQNSFSDYYKSRLTISQLGRWIVMYTSVFLCCALFYFIFFIRKVWHFFPACTIDANLPFWHTEILKWLTAVQESHREIMWYRKWLSSLRQGDAFS